MPVHLKLELNFMDSFFSSLCEIEARREIANPVASASIELIVSLFSLLFSGKNKKYFLLLSWLRCTQFSDSAEEKKVPVGHSSHINMGLATVQIYVRYGHAKWSSWRQAHVGQYPILWGLPYKFSHLMITVNSRKPLKMYE